MIVEGRTRRRRKTTRLTIDPALLERIEEDAVASIPNECCGLLIGRIEGHQGIVDRVEPAANVWAGDRRRRYQIDPQAVFQAFRNARNEGLQIVGFYHSHPDGRSTPSEHDREAAWQGKSYVIVAIREGRVAGVRSWRLEPGESEMSEESIG